MLAQKLILGYTNRLVSQVIAMVAGIVVARLAGPTILGTVAFGMSYVSMFGFIADLGLGSAHVKLVSEGRDLATCNATFGRIKRVLVYLFLAIVGSIVLVQRYYFQDTFESVEHFYVVLIWLVTVTLSQLTQIPLSTFAGLTQQAKQDVPAFFQSLLTSALRVAAVLLGLGALGLSSANLMGIVLLLLAYSYIYRAYPVGKYDGILAREYFKLALPIMVMVFCNTQIEYFDKVMLQYFSSSEQVGQYVAATSLSGFVRTIGSTVGLLFFPLFSTAVTRNDYEFINRTIGKFERLIYILIMPCVILAMIYADQIVRLLLGGRYAPAAPMVAIMLVGMFFYVLNMPYGNLLTGMNRFRIAAILHLANLVFFVGLNGLLLTHVAAAQRAIATSVVITVSILALGYGFRVAVWRIAGQVNAWKHQRYLAFGVLIAACGYFISNILDVRTSVAAALIFPFIFIGLVYGTFFVAKLATKDDIQLALQVVDLRKMYKYIRSEFPKE